MKGCQEMTTEWQKLLPTLLSAQWENNHIVVVQVCCIKPNCDREQTDDTSRLLVQRCWIDYIASYFMRKPGFNE